MTTFIKIPFASSGDKTNPPDTDAAGGVNWTQGYPIAYSKDPATDPSAKRIEREMFNGLLNQLSSAINEIQVNGVAPYITAADNGGSAFVYGIGAIVLYDGELYKSIKSGNTDLPTVKTSWDLLITSSGGSAVPVGVPLPWGSAKPPAGWIKMNGQAINATTYPKLAAIYGSNLPDLRGEFIRGWDDGRGVDAGRAIFSAQGDAIRNIVGSINALGAESGAFYYSRTPSTGSWVHWAADTATHDVLTYGFDASRVVPTASENRPRNIAFNYIVRGE